MIFRIYDSNNASNINQDGWAEMSPTITKEQIQTIVDPNGGQVKKTRGDRGTREITSIPSPWGRLDLVRTAFRNIVASGRVDGDTLDHKIVSDTLDVAQIFYNIEPLRQRGTIELVRWDRELELQGLRQSAIAGHRELERAWSKYLSQDAGSFNFDKLRDFTILRSVHPATKKRIVIAATSPVTLFFPAAGDLSEVSEHITFGPDKPFDGAYCPLTEREGKFIIWLYAMRRSYATFAHDFKEIYDYLDLCQGMLKPALQATINDLSSSSYPTDYLALDFAPGQPVHILSDLGVFVHSGDDAGDIARDSDFVIRSTKPTGAHPR